MTQKITTKIEKYNLDKPTQVTAMAGVLKKHIVTHKLFTPIVGKNYVHVEGWTFAGGLLGLFPKVSKVENISSGQEFKWRADVEIIDRRTDKVVSVGVAICSNKENKKKSFDEYAVLSMAQTRAIGKAYRNLLGWVMKLAGYESTPSEEIVKMGETAPAPKTDNGAPPEIKQGGGVCSVCDEVISKQEVDFSKRIYGKALCRNDQKGAKRK